MAMKIGVLLINLGTPDSTSHRDLRRYLKEFLSDRRVIEKRGVWWWLVLNGLIIPRRARRSARSYAMIWDAERDESPLRTITRAQAQKLSAAFSSQPQLVVDWAMRYGTPSIAATLRRLTQSGCTHILIYPLYPQYSGATTASAMDMVFEAMATMRAQPAIRTLPPYYAHPGYIEALRQSVATHLATLTWEPDILLASFHGLPQSFVDQGDPYQSQCEETTALLRAALGMDNTSLPLVYQSRSGRTEWLGPDLETTLGEYARRGVRNLCVIAPGFAADCVETLEEIQVRAERAFLQAGGENFSTIPCLNASAQSVRMMKDHIEAQLSGWL
jgi:protoporphyrin/coproporphyrin ferrochelatase